MVNASRNNPHDKIARGMLFGLPLLFLYCRKYDLVKDIFEKLIIEHDYMIRMCAINIISICFYGSCDNWAINNFLKVAATDLNNDVRRAAVLGIAFVLFPKP